MQVRRVVGVHRLQDVGGPLLGELADDLHLVVLGQLLQDVGEPVVVQGGRHLHPALGREVVQRVGHIGGAQPFERGDQVLRALPVLLQREAADRRPLHRQRLALRRSAPPRSLADEVLVDLPVAAGGQLLDGHVQDGDLLVILDQPDPPVQELAEDEPLGGPLLEAPHVDDAGGDDLAGLDARHPGHRQEDPPAADHLDHQPQDAGRASADPQHRHQVADPADLVAVGVEDGHPGQVRDEDPRGDRRHPPPPSSVRVRVVPYTAGTVSPFAGTVAPSCRNRFVRSVAVRPRSSLPAAADQRISPVRRDQASPYRRAAPRRTRPYGWLPDGVRRTGTLPSATPDRSGEAVRP